MKDGIEKPRIEVVIASQIPPETCAKINLGYLDPDSINPDEFRNREAEGVLFVEKAGEILHRVKKSL
jgi:hypothetical protein